MIKGHCFTNLDNYHMESWPEIFAAVPRAGERIESHSGKWLRVVGITHTVRLFDGRPISDVSRAAARLRGSEESYIPYILVELHK